IDTHVLTQNPRNDGERELGKTMARTLYGNVKDSNLNQIQLEDLLKNSGLSEGTNWRSLLRYSIMG
nr:hypothetical protein [Lachnospiraceae bacterium]